MKFAEIFLQTAHEQLKPWASEPVTVSGNCLNVPLLPADLLPAVSALCAARWGYLSAITGLDLGVSAGEIEVLYHFCSGPAVVTLRVRLPRTSAAISSLCAVIPSASLFERELSEMLGIHVVGAPDSRRLFLPDDWPEGVYPLRKDAVFQEM